MMIYQPVIRHVAEKRVWTLNQSANINPLSGEGGNMKKKKVLVGVIKTSEVFMKTRGKAIPQTGGAHCPVKGGAYNRSKQKQQAFREER